MKKFFTSESVTEGHPDKICDQISDAILDAMLKDDPNSRVACETLVTTGLVFVAGEVTTKTYVDIEKIVRTTIGEIGYNRAKYGFDCETCAVIASLKGQSEDIAMGVLKNEFASNPNIDLKETTGAGDQGMMFGFACDETDEYMPLAIYLAHKLTKRLAYVRKNKIIPYLRPDGKAQVTIEYDGDKAVSINNIVVSTQHNKEITLEQIKADIKKHVIEYEMPKNLLTNETEYFINPTGRFVIGGPQGDCGLTGRKIIVDTYGGYASHGGGAFSGKDPTKVDRTGAYMARYMAKNFVAAGLCKTCEIEIAYAIGVSKPLSIFVNTRGTGIISDLEITDIINKKFDLRPGAIIEYFDLRRPIYKQTASYGHFGRSDLNLPWEKLDMVKELQK